MEEAKMSDQVEQKTVTVAESPGKTVVVNNTRDGVKKYGTAVAMFVLAAVLQKLKEVYGFDPNDTKSWGPFIMDMLSALGLAGGGLALTSPFDKRGVVIDKENNITLNK
jgi:hypothetical protein